MINKDYVKLSIEVRELDRRILLLQNNNSLFIKKSELAALLMNNISINIEPLTAAPTLEDYNNLLSVTREISDSLSKIKNLVV